MAALAFSAELSTTAVMVKINGRQKNTIFGIEKEMGNNY